MLDLLARDGTARRLEWTLGEHKLATPLALYPHTPRAPAPEHAQLVLAHADPGLAKPWVQNRGSIFATREADPTAALRIAPTLPYTPIGGEDLLQAGESEQRARFEAGEAFTALASQGDLPECEVVVMGTARALLDNPYAFAHHVTRLRERAGPQRLLYAPGCGLPHEIALLAYAGIDLIDGAAAAMAAHEGQYLTPDGHVPAQAARKLPLPCECPACAAGVQDVAQLRAHNQWAVERELRRVHVAIETGKLRELVEMRIRAKPEMAANLRRMDVQEYAFFEARAPVLRDGRLFATSKESLQRPEVRRWHERLHARYVKPDSARILLILPCSARKPYSLSRTHRTLDRALEFIVNRASVHEAILTSPLGIVPRELEMVYPAAHYDLPVTGHWDEDEKAMIREAVTALLARSRYDHVVVHLDESEMDIISGVLPEFHYTADGDPLAPASLENLSNTLRKLCESVPGVRWPEHNLDAMAALARWQFGAAGAALMEGAQVRGKRPHFKILDGEGGAQLASLVPDRGVLSLTLEGGKRLLETGAYQVEIEDFKPKGTVFAVGVTNATPDIRVGDEVVLHHKGKLKGVGRALASGLDIAGMKRGPAVAVRHYA